MQLKNGFNFSTNKILKNKTARRSGQLSHLATQTEFFDQRSITIAIFDFQVVQQFTT
jgi:hypothetical protein